MSLNEEHQIEQIQVRIQKLQQMQEHQQSAYKNAYYPKNHAHDLHVTYDEKTKEDLEALHLSSPISVAGRIMAIRAFGKAAFVHIRDVSGLIQLYVQKNKLGDPVFDFFKTLDIGDIVYATGSLFKTKTNELSIDCDSIELLTKSLRPLPEKYHGIADVEIKYRQRYLDLMMSDHTKDVFKKRSKIISCMRKFFEARAFMEVETPMLHPIAGGAAARPFITHHNTLDMQLYLRIAPELYLKRLVVGGFDRVFEINRNFRNEGISIKHNPEFTMVEFYQAYATFEDLIPLTEELFQTISLEVLGTTLLQYQGTEIDLGKKWNQMTMEASILKHSSFQDPSLLRNKEALLHYCQSKGYGVNAKKDPIGKLLNIIFEEEVESKLIQPTFITHYPLDVSPLSRKNEKDPFLVDRFELFIYGREMANAFSELNDPLDQYQRFEEQVKAKDSGDEEACAMDEDYVRALEYGMPPTAGEGIGVDRLVMLFTDSASIRDVIFFPQLRHQI